MKKQLVSTLLLCAGVIAFSQTDVQARPHHKKRHYSAHHVSKAPSAHLHRAVKKHRFARRGRLAAGYAGGGRPSRWCGWWLGRHLGQPDRKLWLARNWASVGSNASGPGIGVVVVWRSHVGIITGRVGSQWIVKSGNDGRAVRERPRNISNAIAFRHMRGGGGAS